MEEEIKRVENFIEDIKGCGLSDCSSFKDKDVQALENLLHAYRILKENNKYLKMCTIGADPLLRVLKEGFIEKSKIKEKIEQLEKEHKQYIQEWEMKDEVQAQIEILQELLEE